MQADRRYNNGITPKMNFIEYRMDNMEKKIINIEKKVEIFTLNNSVNSIIATENDFPYISAGTLFIMFVIWCVVVFNC